MTMGAQTGPSRPTTPHPHDSRRLDGWLDACCMFCGAVGYFREGERIRNIGAFDHRVHPSGKVLIRERSAHHRSDA